MTAPVRPPVSGQPKAASTALEPAPEFPLSFPQQRLWLVEQLRPGTAAYNVPSGIELSGDLSILALRHALNELVARPETLRTNFVSRQGTPLQVIRPASPVELREVDASGLNPDALQSL